MSREHRPRSLAVYALGSNGSGQLGVGHDCDLAEPAPLKISPSVQQASDDGSIPQVAAGGNHTLLRFAKSTGVLVAGNAAHHDGTERKHPYMEPCAPETISKPEAIAATWNASFFLVNGFVWTTGTGNSGELGLGHGVVEVTHARKIPDFPPEGTIVVDLVASMAHVVAVLSNGQVWGWGKGRKGQLGEPAGLVWSPRKLDGISFAASRAVCGRDFTCVVGKPTEGLLTVLGASGKDPFGIGSGAPIAVPVWKKIVASWGSVFCLLDSGKIVAWGRDDHGQLPPPDLPLVEDIAAGSEHCVALTATVADKSRAVGSTSRKVLAWGWGEHGNCGRPTDERGDVKGRWNELELPHTPLAVFAGCATTFIVVEDV